MTELTKQLIMPMPKLNALLPLDNSKVMEDRSREGPMFKATFSERSC